ncbi:Dss1p [Sugiyamaella lignohabitans]|uniref:Dss1p n=1 Tax=Sugiyamaella lignohabitans TaxID=796027 RepID=A0A161HX18_9ASCO|nr:Dss1p [Sugiyamaella lignohabitans]ANB13253.1 Dss1p [Sugiyamaella lignohabitans]
MRVKGLRSISLGPLTPTQRGARCLSSIVPSQERSNGFQKIDDPLVGSNHFNSEENTNVIPPLSYREILSGIEKRSASYYKVQAGRYAPSKNIIREFGQVSYNDFTSPPAIGDLVLSKYSGPIVLLQRPKDKVKDSNVEISHLASYEKDFLACTASGLIIGVNKSEIIFNMGQLTASTVLNTCIQHVESDGTTVLCLDNVMKRAVCPVLRKLVTDKYANWDELLPVVEQLVNGISRSSRVSAVNVPFFQLAQEVDRCVKLQNNSTQPISAVILQIISNLVGQFPPEQGSLNSSTVSANLLYSLYEAVQMVFDRRLIINSKDAILTVLPKVEVENFDNALSEAKKKPRKVLKELEGDLKKSSTDNPNPLIRRYALGDINPHDVYAQSAAMSLLRKLPPAILNNEEVSPTSALIIQDQLGLMNKEQGPFFGSHVYDFLRESTSVVSPVSFGPLEYDRMDKIREDLGTTIPVYCIDAAGSHEIDDGISITNLLGSQVLVGLHIADPTSSFKDLGDDLLKSAYKQSSTAYFPKGPITMFPTEFTQKFSLENGLGSRRCLTISFIYDEVDRKVVEGSLDIRPQSINKVVNITYDEVNSILDKQDDLGEAAQDLKRLHRISNTLLKKRVENGAINLSINSAAVRIDTEMDREIEADNEVEDLADVKVSIDISTSPSHILVSELMIAANSQVAAFTRKASIPNIYRRQEVVFPPGTQRPDISKGFSEENSFKILEAMRPSTLSVNPGLHQSLGVSEYCGATSPLRRFQDIITHWQVYSHLLGDNGRQQMLSLVQLDTISLKLQAMQTLIKTAQRDSLNFWVLKKIEKGHLGGPKKQLRCTVASRPLLGSSHQRVSLSDWGIYGIIEVEKPLILGEKILCEIRTVNPISRTLLLQYAHEPFDLLFPE